MRAQKASPPRIFSHGKQVSRNLDARQTAKAAHGKGSRIVSAVVLGPAQLTHTDGGESNVGHHLQSQISQVTTNAMSRARVGS